MSVTHDNRKCGKSTKRYHVHVQFVPSALTCILTTDNRGKAVEKVDFWDERIDSFLIDMAREQELEAVRIANLTPLERGLAKLDALEKSTRVKIEKINFPGWMEEHEVLRVVNEQRYILWQAGCIPAGNPEADPSYFRSLKWEEIPS